MRVTVEIDTVKFAESCKATNAQALKAVQNAVAVTLINTESKAKLWCPVDKGRLRSSIKFRIYANGLGGICGTIVNYAIHVELGTFKMRAQPFLFPAFDSEVSQLPKRIGEEWLRLVV